jgi:hypothetical protein
MTPDELQPEDETATQMTVPAFQTGGRVERTGIALVHEGEYIMPAPGSEAAIAPDSGGMVAGTTINYHFPIQVEMVGSLSDEHMQRIAQHVYDGLQTALDSMT